MTEPIKIAILNDYELVVAGIRRMLEPEGFRVSTFPGGRASLDSIEEDIPAGIVLDLMAALRESVKRTQEARGTQAAPDAPSAKPARKARSSAPAKKASTPSAAPAAHLPLLTHLAEVAMSKNRLDKILHADSPAAIHKLLVSAPASR
mgnify:CR=1 FL=1